MVADAADAAVSLPSIMATYCASSWLLAQRIIRRLVVAVLGGAEDVIMRRPAAGGGGDGMTQPAFTPPVWYTSAPVRPTYVAKATARSPPWYASMSAVVGPTTQKVARTDDAPAGGAGGGFGGLGGDRWSGRGGWGGDGGGGE